MFVDYYLVNGHRVLYDTGPGPITLSDIDYLAMEWAKTNQDDLPTSIFLHVSVYSEFINGMISGPRISTVPAAAGYQALQIHTGCGLLRIYPLPFGWSGPPVMVGKQEDLDAYDLDKVFEKIVLSGCESE